MSQEQNRNCIADDAIDALKWFMLAGLALGIGAGLAGCAITAQRLESDGTVLRSWAVTMPGATIKGKDLKMEAMVNEDGTWHVKTGEHVEDQSGADAEFVSAVVRAAVDAAVGGASPVSP